jgi:hypothetical protein
MAPSGGGGGGGALEVDVAVELEEVDELDGDEVCVAEDDDEEDEEDDVADDEADDVVPGSVVVVLDPEVVPPSAPLTRDWTVVCRGIPVLPGMASAPVAARAATATGTVRRRPQRDRRRAAGRDGRERRWRPVVGAWRAGIAGGAPRVSTSPVWLRDWS